jgi:hypothetical protein
MGSLITFLPNGTGEVTVATGVSQNYMRPAWSPDSKRLAYFTAAASDLNNLVISNATAGASQQVVTDVVGQIDGAIAWSPNGSTLLYSAPGGIWRVPASPGAAATVVTIAGPDSRRDYGPSWSPDGTQFAFVRDCNGCADKSKTGLWTASADGSNPRQLVADAVQGPPSWSPDGKMIAFTTWGGANNALRTITSSGTGQTVLMTGPGFLAPSWGGTQSTPKPPPTTPPPTPTPTAPTLLSKPKVTGLLEYGKRLTSSPGAWSGNPTTYMYQWNRCNRGKKRPNCRPISGATNARYTIGQEDLGKVLFTKVMAANAVGRSIGSSAPVTILTPPKGKPVSVTFTILTVTRGGKLTVPVSVKGVHPIVSATVTVEEYGETVKALDVPKQKVNVPVELNRAGQRQVVKRPIVMLTLRIYVVTRVNGKLYSSKETIKTKVASMAR